MVKYYQYREDIRNGNQTPIQRFYENSVILITGGSGFLGRILIEKLLWSCLGIKKIYVLVRIKKNKSPDERFKEIFDGIIFKRLENDQPNFRELIEFIECDFENISLCISEEYINKIKSEVNIVFHGAATVKFDESWRVATKINIQGTKNMLELCKQITNLKVFAHISTAYSNCHQQEIEEIFYKPKCDPDQFINFVNKTDDDKLLLMTPKILGGLPNTYTYTKALAEELVRRNCNDLPIVVLRPAIVISAWREPIAGFSDNLYGPNGLLLGAGIGLLKLAYVDIEKRADLVPVDMVVNNMIAATWDKGTNNKDQKELIYNFSSYRNTLQWKDFLFWSYTFGQTYPTINALWYYFFHFTKNLNVYYVYTFLLHIIPGAFLDLILIICMKKPQFLKIYKKYFKLSQLLEFFSTQQWKFHDDNVMKLWSKLCKRDQEIFTFDIEVIDWDEYFFKTIKVLREVIFKDPLATVPEARTRMYKLKILHYFVVFLLSSLFIYFLYCIYLRCFF